MDEQPPSKDLLPVRMRALARTCRLPPADTELQSIANTIEAWANEIERAAAEPEFSAVRAYELGWRSASEWAGRDDLIADIGSPVYEQDRAKAFGTAQPPRDGQ